VNVCVPMADVPDSCGRVRLESPPALTGLVPTTVAPSENVTVPVKLGDPPPTGATVAFRLTA
jgi:hypothetical protein